MNREVAATLRRAAAHVLVDDVAAPVIDDDTAHHLFRVLRVADGATVTVTDGRGRWRCCRAVGASIEPDGNQHVEPQREHLLTVGFAIPKHDRPEWIVQKLTEVGVDRIVLLHAQRSVVRWHDDRTAKRLAKLQRVAVEALQQSRGVWIPVVLGPIDAAELLPEAVVAEPGGRTLSAFDTTIVIGPEGGWTDAELERGLDRVAIGSPVLRVETAAIAAGVRMTSFADDQELTH